MIWGSSFILMKKALLYFEPEHVGGLRVMIASLALSPVAVWNLRRVSFSKSEIFGLLIVGLLGNTIPAFLFAIAQTEVPSAISGVLNALVPLLTLIIGALFFGSRIHRWQFLLLATGFAGAIVLVLGRYSPFTGNSFGLGFILLIIIATLFYGTSNNTIQRYLSGLKAIHITSFAFGFMLVPIIIVNYFTGLYGAILNDFSNIYPGLIYVGILALVGTATAVVVYNVLIKETGAVFASTVTYLMPVVAVMWGLVDGETFGLTDFLGFSLILISVYFMNLKRRKVLKQSAGYRS